MNRYYENGIPESNYHSALYTAALGVNNHTERVFIDPSNEYGARVIINCWSEHDIQFPEDQPQAIRWYSVRDHKGDVLIAEMQPPTENEIQSWALVWKRA